ncbi:MAG: DUF3097 family protein [Acidimicrobiales bacterium]
MAGILSDPIADGPRRQKSTWPKVHARKGLTVRHRTTGYVGAIVRFAGSQVTIRDKRGREHALPNADGAFSVDGETVSLIKPKPAPTSTPSETASGSIPPPDAGARVARPSRILVEGIHDAELVEKVWGDDLRAEGVVVVPLHGADDLAGIVDEFDPTEDRRLGVLLDHLVSNTKESHIAATIDDENVLITGHPYVDVWQAIKPEVIGIPAWPEIPKGTDWKTGMCAELGFNGPPGALWPKLLARVSSYRHLEPGLVGAVEQLIDFVAPPPDLP